MYSVNEKGRFSKYKRAVKSIKMGCPFPAGCINSGGIAVCARQYRRWVVVCSECTDAMPILLSDIICVMRNMSDFEIISAYPSDTASNGLLLLEWTLFGQTFEYAGSLYMTLSSISGTNISNRNTFIPTKALNVVQTGSHGGTGRGGDTFHCSTCGGSKVSPSFRSPVSAGSTAIRTSNPSAASSAYGNYCPTCGGGSSRSAADSAGVVYFHGPRTGR